MEQKLQDENGKKEIPPLPPESDPFWEGAEKYLFTVGPNVLCEKHFFIRKSGIEAECRDCHVGYQITPDFDVQNGHIVQHGQRVV